MKISNIKLVELVKNILINAGAIEENAQIVSELLVAGNLSGHDSHGIIRTGQYVNQIKAGIINPKAKPVLEVNGTSHIKINGQRSFGQVAASFTIEKILEKLENTEVVIASCINMSHIGRLGDYVSKLSKEGYLALAMCNGGGPNVAAYGSKERLLGTNPLAAGIPLTEADDIQVDFASAATAEGKLNIARNKNEMVGDSLLLDKNGKASNNPSDFYDDGVILPIGWHKGSALSIVLEIFAGIFTGGRCSVFDDYVDGNGLFILATKPDLYRSKDEFESDMHLFREKIKSSKCDDNTTEILFPGEKENTSMKNLTKEGITLDSKTLEILNKTAEEVKIKIDQYI